MNKTAVLLDDNCCLFELTAALEMLKMAEKDVEYFGKSLKPIRTDLKDKTEDVLRLRPVFLLRRRYLRGVRFPFNGAYHLLMLAGSLGFGWILWQRIVSKGGSWDSDWVVFVMLQIIFMIVWVGTLYAIRWHHRDSGIMFKLGERLALHKKEMRCSYTTVKSGALSFVQYIRYSDIVELALLRDERTDLRVLQVKAKYVRLQSFHSSDSSPGTSSIGYSDSDLAWHFALYYDRSDELVAYLAEKTKLPVKEGRTDIRKLKDKTI